ncbi:hypothetical protein HU200_055020 [Digitaria exilis]|uniref:Cytochrome b561 domain-containing protein n=1 Tax=Digitaria exilis TaxID=1010633 RepID=A0A835E732_9POAL|nr:hypothetical protein HU200_055020 [Digitaria exilis]
MARITRAPNRLATRQCTPRPPLHVLVVALCLASSYLPSASSQSARTRAATASASAASSLQHHGLVCFQAWPSQDFILRVSAQLRQGAGNNVWSFVLSAPDNGGYIAIGFSRPGGWWGAAPCRVATGAGAGSSAARQYYLGGTSSSSCPPDQGKLALVAAARPTVVSKGSRLYLAFQLAGQPLTDVVYAVGPTGSLPGPTGFSPSTGHGVRHHQLVRSGSGTGGGSPATAAVRYKDSIHAPISFLGAIVMIDSRAWVNMQVTATTMAEKAAKVRVSTVTMATRRRREGREEHVAGFIIQIGHRRLLSAKRRHGVLAVVSWGAMVPAGVAFARFLKRFDPFWFYAHAVAQGIGEGDEARRYWNLYHHSVGRVAVALGVANVFYGLSLANERQEWSYVYGVFIGSSPRLPRARGVETQALIRFILR